MLGQAVAGGFGGGGFQVVQVAVHFLIVGKAFAHVVQHILGELLGFHMGQVLADPVGVQAGFVHANQADGGEVVGKAAQVTLGVGIQAFVEQAGDDVALDLQRTGRNVHQIIKTLKEIIFVFGKISNTGNVNCNNAY